MARFTDRIRELTSTLDLTQEALVVLTDEQVDALESLCDDHRDNYSDDRVTDPTLCLVDMCDVVLASETRPTPTSVEVHGTAYDWVESDR